MRKTTYTNMDYYAYSDLAPVIKQKLVKSNTTPIKLNNKVQNKVIVSCQDIRNLYSTLYLKSIPGLEEIESDYGILIDEYYEPIQVTD